MGNCPSPLRDAIRMNDRKAAIKIIEKAGDKAPRTINEDYSQDCILQACTRATGNSFYYAAGKNRLEIVECMLQHGADVESTGECGETCLHLAARFNYLDMVKLLIGNGLKHHLHTTDDRGRIPIQSAANYLYNTTNVIRYLAEEAGSREDVNTRDYTQRTPLHDAAFHQNALVAKTLIELGADVNATSGQGNTPLHLARRDSEVWKLLIESGADTEALNHENKKPGQFY